MRRVDQVIAAAAVSFAAVVVCGPLSYTLNPQNGFLISVASQIPILGAVALQVSIQSSAVFAEDRAVLSVWKIDAIFLVAATLLLVVLLYSSGQFLNGSEEVARSGQNGLGGFALARNAIAFVGAACLSASLFGHRLGWLLPLSWGVIPYLYLRQGSPSNELLALVAQADNSFDAFAFSIAIWFVGVTTLLFRRRLAQALARIWVNLRWTNQGGVES